MAADMHTPTETLLHDAAGNELAKGICALLSRVVRRETQNFDDFMATGQKLGQLGHRCMSLLGINPEPGRDRRMGRGYNELMSHFLHRAGVNDAVLTPQDRAALLSLDQYRDSVIAWRNGLRRDRQRQ
jgi:hypothetical protein